MTTDEKAKVLEVARTPTEWGPVDPNCPRCHGRGRDEDPKCGCVADPESYAAHTLRDLLLLVSKRATLKAIRAWTPKQREEAEEWAAAEHFHASDNPVRRLPVPLHVQALPEVEYNADYSQAMWEETAGGSLDQVPVAPLAKKRVKRG